MISKAERETIVRIAEDESDWTVFTESPSFIKKLDRYGHIGKKDGAGVRYTVPRKAFTLKRPRVISETQKEALRQRMAKMRQTRPLSRPIS